MIKFFRLSILMAMIAVAMTGCGDDEKEPQPAIQPQSQEALTQTVYADQTDGKSGVTFVTTGPWTSTIKEGTLKAGTDPWVSIDPASGDKAGTYTITIKLEPNDTGSERSAVITITCNGEEIKITVTQKGTKEDGSIPVSGITLDKTTLTIEAGMSEKLTATVAPDDAGDKTVVWSSSNKTIATVSETGVVTAIAEGSAIITATTKDGGKTAECAIMVMENKPGPPVYVAGWNGNSRRWAATLWIDGEAQDLSDGTESSASYSVYVSAGDVYVAGTITNTQGNMLATLWKNGKAQRLMDGRTNEIAYSLNEIAYSVYVSAGDVYVAGYVNNTQGTFIATLWKNGEAQSLSDGTTESSAYSVYVSAGDVYVAGHVNNSQGRSVAMLWKNGAAQSLSDGTDDASAHSVYVSAGDVYVAGYVTNSQGFQVATLWKNGAAQSLSDGTTNARANSVYVSGNGVYVAGVDKYVATLWKNGAAQSLLKVSNSSANSVFISGNDVYVVGYEPSNSSGILWKNGVGKYLQDLKFANSVFVQ